MKNKLKGYLKNLESRVKVEVKREKKRKKKFIGVKLEVKMPHTLSWEEEIVKTIPTTPKKSIIDR
jgi:hydrogenase maturation factor HypF (carbamoyltransferase family)